jgi:molecular chaperone DnaJ
MSDPYTTLGVSRHASQDDIKKAYRKLAHQHHPDKTGGNDAKFKEINEAYQILSDQTKRQQYDQFGHVGGNGGFGNGAGSDGFDFSGFSQGGFDFGQGGGGFEDIFDIFSGAFGGARSGFRSHQQAPQKGADLHLEVRISKKDAGTTKQFEFEAYNLCDECKGTGVAPGSKMKDCGECRGAGQVRQSVRTPFGTFSTARVCGTCKGKGNVPEKTCSTCHSHGRIKTKRHMEVRIPSNLENGYVVIAPKQGNAGPEGAPAGDLVLTFRVK